MKLLIERINPNAKLPTISYQYDAGFDIYSPIEYVLPPGENIIIKTGLKMAVPEGHVALIWDKSGLGKEKIHSLGGVIDSGFRGEITINLINLGKDDFKIEKGQKIVQMLIQKVETPEIIEAKIDDQTERADSTFGGSGKF